MNMTLYDFLTWYTRYNGNNFPQHFTTRAQESDFKFVEVSNRTSVFYYIKRKKARIVSTCPYIPPNKHEKAGAWAILMLHHKHFKNLNEIFLRDSTNLITYKNMAISRLESILETSITSLGNSYSEAIDKQIKLQNVMKTMKKSTNNKNQKVELSESDSDNEEDEIYDATHHDVLYDECENDGDNHIHEYSGNPANPSVHGIHAVSNEIYMRAKRFIESTKQKADEKRQQELESFRKPINIVGVQRDIYDEGVNMQCAENLKRFDTLYSRLKTNSEQLEAFHIVAAHILQQPSVFTEDNVNGQLRMFISGQVLNMEVYSLLLQLEYRPLM
jgi:hypothetical protein